MQTAIEQQLKWESSKRTAAAIAGLIGAAGLIVALFGSTMVFGDQPRVSVLDSLARLSGGSGALNNAQSLQVPVFKFFNDRWGALVAIAVARALGFTGCALILFYLAKAVRARSSALNRFAAPAVMVGAGVSATVVVAYNIVVAVSIHNFLTGTPTVANVASVVDGQAAKTLQAFGGIGAIIMGIGFLLICLHAMRTGLLPRLVGVLGVSIGALSALTAVIPLGMQLQLLQGVWLVMLSLLVLGRWPGGAPLAWRSGKAEPPPARMPKVSTKGDQAPDIRVDEPITAAVGVGVGQRSNRKRNRRK